jgi:Protein of unknown function (DUF1565)
MKFIRLPIFALVSMLGLALGTQHPVNAQSICVGPMPSGPLGNKQFVSPSGIDSGLGTQSQPFATLQHALDVAIPNTTILLCPGMYHERVAIRRDGPLTIRALQSGTAIIDGLVVGALGARFIWGLPYRRVALLYGLFTTA